MADGDDPGMTVHLNLLAEQAEEALRRQASFRRQHEIVAMDAAQARPGAMRRLIARVTRRRRD